MVNVSDPQRATGDSVIQSSRPFFDWLATWNDRLPGMSWEDVFRDPKRSAILVTDLIVGFCHEGPLASERVNAVVPRTVQLLQQSHAMGVEHFVFAQDTHNPDTPEFEAWPPHCVRGTRESNMIPELANLPFSSRFLVIEKNALTAGIATEFNEWLEVHDEIQDYLVTGDCTDLCTYQMAMHVRMWANATNRPARRVVVDASAVDTYDLPVTSAQGVLPHPGDFIHMFFLYHMALNGIVVTSHIG